MQILLMQQGKFLLLGIKKRQIMCKNIRHLIRKFTNDIFKEFLRTIKACLIYARLGDGTL